MLALKALERDGSLASYYNLGTGNGFSVREVIEAASMGTAHKHTEGPRRPGDPPSLVADATRAGTDLGWKPGYDDLIEIVTTAWDWMKRSDLHPTSSGPMTLHVGARRTSRDATLIAALLTWAQCCGRSLMLSLRVRNERPPKLRHLKVVDREP